MSFLRAKYGAKDNRHNLLECEGNSALWPSELLGLTDRPCGTYAPGDNWSPSVGCEPLGTGWALWWTVPDEEASRGGMVISKVALWPSSEIGNVDDLRPIMELLSGTAIPATPPDLLYAVAEALVFPEAGSLPPVIPNLEAWPGIIADLWTRLWPEARRAFSARVTLNPPQGVESVAPPWIFCTPATRSPEWLKHRLITVSPTPKPVSRAAAWLVRHDDPIFTTVLTECNVHPADLKSLSLIACAADCLDNMQRHSEPQQALDLLRTLVVLAPYVNTADALKAKALQILEGGLANASLVFIMSLANLGSALPEEKLPQQALGAWISQQIPIIPPQQSARLLKKLMPNRAELWWRHCVQEALAKELANPDALWAKVAMHWLGSLDCADALKDILPAKEIQENRLLEATASVELSETELQQLKSQTQERNWSRLHAWVVMKLFPVPSDAFQAQREFPGNRLPGLAYLISQLPGDSVVAEAIAISEHQFTQWVAQRTAKEPHLLQALDVTLPAWRALWAAHVNAGGVHWPLNSDRKALGSGLLDAILAKDEPPELIAKLAADLADIAFGYPKRAELWQALSPAGCTALLDEVAKVLIRNCNAGDSIAAPEQKLKNAVAKQARITHPSAKLLAELLSWDVQLSEEEVIEWLITIAKTKQGEELASSVGLAIATKRWKHAAKKIYDLFMSRSISKLIPALKACQDLLNWWDRTLFSLKISGNNPTTDPRLGEQLTRRVAELGQDIALEELDSIWELAGGKRKDLKNYDNYAERWQYAANLAHKGGLKKGLLGLVAELKIKRPYNEQLEQVELLLINYNKSIRK